MAYTSGFTGDATGGIGQGLAFVLPDSKAATYAMQLAQTHATQLQEMARQKQTQQFQIQKQYEEDFKNQKLPTIAAPFVKMFSDKAQDWRTKAAGYHVKTGRSPFDNPDMMADWETGITQGAAKANELWTNYTKQRAIAETDPTNKYTKDSKQKIIDYEQYMMKNPDKALNQPIPTLQENPATLDDMVKTLKPSGDASYNKAQIFSAALGDPKWHDTLAQYGYNAQLPDFGVYTDPKSPNGKRVWYTNPTYTAHQADLVLESPDDPRSKHILQTLGIDPTNDKFAKEKLQHAISDQNAAMGKFVTDASTRMYDPEKAQMDADRRLQNQNIRSEMSHRAWEEQQKKNPAVFVDNIFGGNRNDAYEGLKAISKLYETSPVYGTGIENLKDDGNIVSGTIPARKVKNPNWVPGIKSEKIPQFLESQKAVPFSLDRRNPEEFKAGLYSLMHNVGGAASISKFMGGKPTGTNQNKKTNTKDPLGILQ